MSSLLTTADATTTEARPDASTLLPQPAGDSQTSDAFAFVIGSLRATYTKDAQPSAISARPSSSFWTSVVGVAEQQRVVPQLLAALRAAPAPGSEHAISLLEAAALRIAQRNLALTRELLSVLAELRARSVVAVPYKGPAAAQQLFGGIALRQMNDVDALVLPRDVAAASDALIALGYRIEPPADRVPRAFYIRHASEYTFRKPDSDVDIELHWRVLPPAFPFTVDLGSMFAQTRDLDLCGTTVAAFSSEDLLLLLSLHGLKHLFFQLRLICDIAQLLTLGVDWPVVLDRAEQARATRTVLLAAALAHEMLDAPLPNAIINRIQADAGIAKLASQVPAHLRDPNVEVRAGRHRFYAGALDGTRERMAYAFRTLTGPTEAEWGTMRLPRPLYPIYRVGRLAAKAARGFVRSGRTAK